MDRPSSIAALKDARFLEQAAEAGEFTGRGIQCFKEHLPALGTQAEARYGPLASPSALSRASQVEFADRPVRRFSGGLKLLLGLRRKPEIQFRGASRSSWHGSVSCSLPRGGGIPCLPDNVTTRDKRRHQPLVVDRIRRVIAWTMWGRNPGQLAITSSSDSSSRTHFRPEQGCLTQMQLPELVAEIGHAGAIPAASIISHLRLVAGGLFFEVMLPAFSRGTRVPTRHSPITCFKGLSS